MTTETKHTPRDWRARRMYYGSSDNYSPYVSDGDTARVLFFMNISGAYGGFAGKVEAENDAQHIVRCVNSHDDLLSALETLLESVEGKKVTFGDCNQARAAIERATKG